MKKPDAVRTTASETERQFCAEGTYAEGIVRTALGDHEASAGKAAALAMAALAHPALRRAGCFSGTKRGLADVL
jgi:hypothetical protein